MRLSTSLLPQLVEKLLLQSINTMPFSRSAGSAGRCSNGNDDSGLTCNTMLLGLSSPEACRPHEIDCGETAATMGKRYDQSYVKFGAGKFQIGHRNKKKKERRGYLIPAVIIFQVLKNAITILLIENLPLQLSIQHIHALIYVSHEVGPTGRRRILV